jgi:hypothetical protein
MHKERAKVRKEGYRSLKEMGEIKFNVNWQIPKAKCQTPKAFPRELCVKP